jgi:hypothetical protein
VGSSPAAILARLGNKYLLKSLMMSTLHSASVLDKLYNQGGLGVVLIHVIYNHSLETSNCSGPALNSVKGETYTQENGGRLNLPLD